jgi:hypothetical protein
MKSMFAVFSVVLLSSCIGDLYEIDECIFAYTVTPDFIEMAPGDSTTVRANRVSGCNGTMPVSWSVQESSVATVRSTGDSTAVVRAIANGVGNLTVEGSGGNGFAVIRVTEE